MEKAAGLLEHLLIAHPLNQLVLDLIQHPSGAAEGMREPWVCAQEQGAGAVSILGGRQA